MTAQRAEIVIVENSRLDLGRLSLRAIIKGDPAQNHGWGDGEYPLPLPPFPQGSRSCSGLRRGYVGTFVLREDGAVELRSCCYPFADRAGDRGELHIGKILEGDFWLVLSERFGGPRTFIPVLGGYVVEDRRKWQFDAHLEEGRQS